MKALIVGDPHIRPEDVESVGQPLVKLLLSLASQEKTLILLGDLFHNHALVHLRVSAFWREALQALMPAFGKVIILLGNHDAPHDLPEGINALCEFKAFAGDKLLVVDKPTLWCGHLFLPFFRETEQFEAALKAFPAAELVICHQEFNGSKYENGFFSSHGADPLVVDGRRAVISGHIHLEQEFANIWYPGSPRWLTSSDANADKGIWEVDLGTLERTKVPTAGYLPRILSVEDSQKVPVSPESLSVFPHDQITVTLRGSQEWIDSRRQTWTGIAKVKGVPDRQEVGTFVSESEGILPALHRYLDQVANKEGVSGKVLFDEISKRVSSRSPIFAQ